jgi:LPXTG-site transpeptidase (sortase) family protein
MNPLFPDEPAQASGQPAPNGAADNSYVLSQGQRTGMNPLGNGRTDRDNAAVDMIRNKINALYDDEPNARKELAEAKTAHTPRSRHQQFMYDLSTSGKSLAEIQTAWHAYYQGLNDADKHEVWQEFYAANNQKSSYTKYVQKQAGHTAQSLQTQADNTPAAAVAPTPPTPASPMPGLPHIATPHVVAPTMATLPRPAVPRAHTPSHTAHKVVVAEHLSPEPPEDKRSFATIKRHVAQRAKASYNAQAKARQHLQSLIFGLGLGGLVLVVLLFSFFNEVIVAPFIHPNAHAQATPIILNTDGVAPSDKNEVIIPKINVQLPIVYGSSTNEKEFDTNLEDGIVHYPTTSLPGQGGNAAYFGHSSNNIFNKGQYKFAFVLLHELEPGDIFYITYNGKLYTYKVFQKKIVEPTEIGVLNPVADKPATAALITCDPPGTSLRRLVVWGEQITPDPVSNSTAPVQQTVTVPVQLPSNSPSLWHRLTSWFR